MAILLNNNGYDQSSWRQALRQHLPDDLLYDFEQIDDSKRADIEFAVVWDHPLGDLVRYPNLQGILLLGAGTEHIDQETELPNVPVVRLIDPVVARDMANYSLYWVMHFHRRYEDYRQQQLDKHWQRHDIMMQSEYTVCVLGLGAIGRQVAQILQISGFNTIGWDAFSVSLDAIDTFHGTSAFDQAVNQADAVINCLPLTDSTQDLLSTAQFAAFKPGAVLINISRGAIIDNNALINALNSGHLSAAVLDAHRSEPLPESSSLWQTPNIYITPHIAGATYARSAAKVIAGNIHAIRSGAQPQPIHIPPCQRTLTKPAIANTNETRLI